MCPSHGKFDIGGIPDPNSMDFVDGSSILDVSGAEIILTSLEGFKVQQAIHFQFKATNNESEYEAILAGLRLAWSLEVQRLVIFSDS